LVDPLSLSFAIGSYAALGLVADVNEVLSETAAADKRRSRGDLPGPGPSEDLSSHASAAGLPQDPPPPLAGNNDNSKSKSRLPSGKGRILRDAAGNVVGVEIPEDDDENDEHDEEEEEEEEEDSNRLEPMQDDREPTPVHAKTDVAAGALSVTRHITFQS
jgi:hypothetical protein